MKTRWNGETIANIDLLLTLVIVFAAFALTVIPAKPDAKAGTNPGAIMVEVWWDDAADADIDLWVVAPGGKPVGYSHKTDLGMALLRDDLGHSGDRDSKNYEIAVGNEVRAGEYVANLHYYRYRSGPEPTPFEVRITVKPPAGDPYVIADQRGAIGPQGQEITVIRWTMDKAGHLVAGSINDLPMGLRTAW